MKKGLVLLMALLVLLGVSSVSMAAVQLSDSKDFQVKAFVYTSIVINVEKSMDFGKILDHNASTQIVLDPVNTAAGQTPAQFLVTGAADAPYYVTLPKSVEIYNGLDHLTVTGFTSTLSADLSTETDTNVRFEGAINGQSFKLGATLKGFADNMAGGLYSGNATITAAYKI